jgi:hypothetical protein
MPLQKFYQNKFFCFEEVCVLKEMSRIVSDLKILMFVAGDVTMLLAV